MINVAINGFGRIGRRVFRLLLNNPNIQVVSINDLADSKTLSHLLKYDSIHGVLPNTISSDSDHIIIDGKKVNLQNQNHPKLINWKPYNIDVVIEAKSNCNFFVLSISVFILSAASCFVK